MIVRNSLSRRITDYRRESRGEKYRSFVERFVKDMNVFSGRHRFDIQSARDEYVLFEDGREVGRLAPIWVDIGDIPLVGGIAILTEDYPEPVEDSDAETKGPNVFDWQPENVRRAMAFCSESPEFKHAR